mmetsp:Transcript_51646/g.129598  ORF Transcript_51646/g.129598 Transcript_51646/m.129598 type:complete len:211 (+) Transcript_51646:40-672(+)
MFASLHTTDHAQDFVQILLRHAVRIDIVKIVEFTLLFVAIFFASQPLALLLNLGLHRILQISDNFDQGRDERREHWTSVGWEGRDRYVEQTAETDHGHFLRVGIPQSAQILEVPCEGTLNQILASQQLKVALDIVDHDGRLRSHQHLSCSTRHTFRLHSRENASQQWPNKLIRLARKNQHNNLDKFASVRGILIFRACETFQGQIQHHFL